MPVQCTCRHCGATFATNPAYLRRGGGLYCSPACSNTARRRRVACICDHCGADFEIKLSEQQYGRGRWCSKQCQDDARGRLLATFWTWLDRGDPDGCWPWTRARRTGEGYGTLRVGTTNVLAHRYAWELTYGTIPDGLVVCHVCDNPPCCRPDHLTLGTQTDNMADMVTKNRRGRDPSKRNTAICPTCSTSFSYYRSWPRKFCSRACSGKANVANLSAGSRHVAYASLR